MSDLQHRKHHHHNKPDKKMGEKDEEGGDEDEQQEQPLHPKREKKDDKKKHKKHQKHHRKHGGEREEDDRSVTSSASSCSTASTVSKNQGNQEKKDKKKHKKHKHKKRHHKRQQEEDDDDNNSEEEDYSSGGSTSTASSQHLLPVDMPPDFDWSSPSDGGKSDTITNNNNAQSHGDDENDNDDAHAMPPPANKTELNRNRNNNQGDNQNMPPPPPKHSVPPQLHPPLPTERHMNDSTMPPPTSAAARVASPPSSPTPSPRRRAGTGVPAVPPRKGFGLHDWAVLTKSANDLAQRKGAPLRRITVAELRTHNKPYDGWMALKGNVYNVGPYLPYHPGGEAILKPVLGKDGTTLFEKYHRWVNMDGLIGTLQIGYLDTRSSGKDDEDEEDDRANVKGPAAYLSSAPSGSGTAPSSPVKNVAPPVLEKGKPQQQLPSVFQRKESDGEDDDDYVEPWET